MSTQTAEKKMNLTLAGMMAKHGLKGITPNDCRSLYEWIQQKDLEADRFPRRRIMKFARLGWIETRKKVESFEQLSDYSVTKKGVEAFKKITAAYNEFKAQKK